MLGLSQRPYNPPHPLIPDNLCFIPHSTPLRYALILQVPG